MSEPNSAMPMLFRGVHFNPPPAAGLPPPSPCHYLRVDRHVVGFRVQVVAASGAVVSSFPFLAEPAAIGRLVREWCEGRHPRVRVGDTDVQDEAGA